MSPPWAHTRSRPGKLPPSTRAARRVAPYTRVMDLIVVAKAPVPGRVKTRLCPPCTAGDAAGIAAAALSDTLAAAGTSGADRVVLALDGEVGPWCPPGVEVVDQGGGGLDERLTRAWAATPGPAVQIGMDTPQVTAGDLDRAMGTLVDGDADAVIGPASDGGWWAVGLRRPHPRAFVGIPTSRSDTGARQAARLAGLGLRTRALATLTDVDTWEDARVVATAAPGTRFAEAVRRIGSAT